MTTRRNHSGLSLTSPAHLGAAKTVPLCAVESLPGVGRGRDGALIALGAAAVAAGCVAVEQGEPSARFTLREGSGWRVYIEPAGAWRYAAGGAESRLADDLLTAVARVGIGLGREAGTPWWTCVGKRRLCDPQIDEVQLRPFDREVEPEPFVRAYPHMAHCRHLDRSFLYGWEDSQGIVAGLVAVAEGVADDARFFVADHPTYGDQVHHRCRVTRRDGAWRLDDRDVGRDLCVALATVSFALGQRVRAAKHSVIFRAERRR